MKEVRITLDEATVAALEASVAAGEAASIEELIATALDAFLEPDVEGRGYPTAKDMRADLAAADRDLARGGRLYSADEVRQFLEETDGA